MFVNIGKDIIWESKTVKLLGITIDKELKFDKYINQVCSKTNKKLNVLSRMRSFLSVEKRKISLLSLLLNHNSNTVPWFGCFAAEKAMIKSIGFMKDH